MTSSTQRRRERRDKRRENTGRAVSFTGFEVTWRLGDAMARYTIRFSPRSSLRLTLRSLRLCVEFVSLFGSVFPLLARSPSVKAFPWPA